MIHPATLRCLETSVRLMKVQIRETRHEAKAMPKGADRAVKEEMADMLDEDVDGIQADIEKLSPGYRAKNARQAAGG